MRTIMASGALMLLVAAAGAGEPMHRHDHTSTVGTAPTKGSARSPWGRPGDAAAVSRTIEVRMRDDMRYDPRSIEVRAGETVRFVVFNEGRLEHEFVLGDRREIERHAAAMRKGKADHAHHGAGMIELEGGRRAELIWTFDRAGTFSYACLVPGHYEAGMVGQLTVARPR